MNDNQKCRWTHRILDKFPTLGDWDMITTDDVLALMDYAYREGCTRGRSWDNTGHEVP